MPNRASRINSPANNAPRSATFSVVSSKSFLETESVQECDPALLFVSIYESGSVNSGLAMENLFFDRPEHDGNSIEVQELSQIYPEANSSMKALVLKKPGDASVETIPDPVAAPGELLLRVRMVGFCGSDLNSFRGRNPLVTFPRILGHEVSATVIEGDSSLPTGTDVALSPYTSCGRCASCRRGRPNACQFNQTLGVQRDGALAEFVAVPREKLYPAKLTRKELCLVEPLTVGFHAVARGRIEADDTVAILGCGGVGLGAVAAANARGARTICVDMDDEKLFVARAAGGSDAINTAKEPLHDRLQDLTEGRGPDVVIEAIGTPQTFRAAVEEVAFTGRVVYIGYAKEPVSYETRLFVQKELDILGSRNALPEDFRAVIHLLEKGEFPVDQAVSLVVPLEEAAGALRSWSENPASFKKIMVTVD